MRWATNVQHWERITFLHWPVRPDDIRRRIPHDLQLDLWHDTAWVGVTPFRVGVRPLGVPVVPPGASFPETNVRTYVVGPDGRQAIWFLHMEVTARWFVGALRTLGLPYVRRSMEVVDDPHRIRYASRPNDAGSGGHDIVVRPGPALDPTTGGSFERFLTARWTSYHRVGPLLLRTGVEHPPWQLRSATVERCDVAGLFAATGLRPPAGDPCVQFSEGVEVRVGAPRFVSATDRSETGGSTSVSD